MSDVYRQAAKPVGWAKHPHLDAYEFRDHELRARVAYFPAHGVDYIWSVGKIEESLPDFTEMYEVMAAGDTIGKVALEQAFNEALLAICDIRLGPGATR